MHRLTFILCIDLDEGEFDGSFCKATGDPHITTFDGQYYNRYLEGEFVMYRHKKLPYAMSIHAEYILNVEIISYSEVLR